MSDALHQANVTGNYTVLRDLAAPSFRDRNSAADLARVFAPIRDEHIDLSSVVVLDPQLAAAPIVDDGGRLRVEGTLPTEPAAVAFQLLFQAVDGAWRLFGISIAPVRHDTTANAVLDGTLVSRNAPPPLGGSLVPPTPRPRPAIAPSE